MTDNIYQSDIAQKSFNNRFKILIITLTALFMAVLNTNIVNVALPTITRFYNVPVGLSQWVITGYQVINIITPLIFAKLSNYTGKSKLFIMGLSVFTVSSLICGISTSLTELISFRIIQALGASMISSINLAILMQVFPSHEKGRVMGYFTAVIGFGMLMGPTVGGFLIDSLGWTYIFFVNLPIGVALLLPALKYLKIEEYIHREKYEDYTGALLFMVSIGTFFMLLNVLSNVPINRSLVTLYSALCAVTFTAFIIREHHVQRPFLNISIFRIRDFTLPNTSLALYFTATFILVLIQPFYFEGVMNFSPAKVGLVASIMPLAMMLSSPVSGRIYDGLKLRESKMVKNYAMMGVAVMGMAYLVCGYAFQGANFGLAVVTFAVAGICRSIFQGPNNLDIINSLPPEKSALASSITVTTQSFGLALGTAMGTLLLSALLVTAGYSGNVVNASAGLLQNVCGNIMYISAVLCFLGAFLSYKPLNND